MQIAFRTHDLNVRGVTPAVGVLKDIGVSAVQLVAYKFIDEIKYEVGALTEKNSLAVGEELKRAGVDVKLIGAYFNPVHSDKQKVMRGVNIFKEYLKYSKNLGCNIVGSETGSFNDDKWTYNPLNRTPGALKTIIETFSELADYAKSVGAFVGIEGAAGHVCYDVKTLNAAYKAIGASNVKIIFDIYNYLDDGNYKNYLEILDEGLKTFSGNIAVFHIKDCVIEGGKPKQVAVGKGVLDFEKILKKIKDYDSRATLVLEGTSGEDKKPAADFIREIWERV